MIRTATIIILALAVLVAVGDPPRPPAAGDFAAERLAMVESQIARPWDGRRPVENEAVLAAMRASRFLSLFDGKTAYSCDWSRFGVL